MRLDCVSAGWLGASAFSTSVCTFLLVVGSDRLAKSVGPWLLFLDLDNTWRRQHVSCHSLDRIADLLFVFLFRRNILIAGLLLLKLRPWRVNNPRLVHYPLLATIPSIHNARIHPFLLRFHNLRGGFVPRCNPIDLALHVLLLPLLLLLQHMLLVVGWLSGLFYYSVTADKVDEVILVHDGFVALGAWFCAGFAGFEVS